MDKDLIVRRIADLLKEMPSGEDIVKKGGNRDKRFLYLARYMLEKSLEKDALILSHDGLGIAMLFEADPNENTFWKELWADLRLAFKVTGLKNALKILKNQNYIKAQRPKNEKYLYAWFWGVVEQGRGAGTQVASDMKNQFLKKSEETGLPIYAETQLRVNTVVYQRYGFELFHTWKQTAEKTMWFLRYVPKSYGKKNGTNSVQ